MNKDKIKEAVVSGVVDVLVWAFTPVAWVVGITSGIVEFVKKKVKK